MIKRLSLAVAPLALSVIALVGLVMPPATTRAAVAEGCSSSFLGLPTWFRYLDVEKVQTSNGEICQVVGPCVNIESGTPSNNCTSGSTRLNIPVVIQRVAIAILDILLRIAGIVAFIYLIYSGFKFVLSEGDSNKAKDARNAALNAAIGLGIAIVATSVVAFIGRSISN